MSHSCLTPRADSERRGKEHLTAFEQVPEDRSGHLDGIVDIADLRFVFRSRNVAGSRQRMASRPDNCCTHVQTIRHSGADGARCPLAAAALLPLPTKYVAPQRHHR